MVANTFANMHKYFVNFHGQQEGQDVGKANIVQNDNHFKGRSDSSCESLEHNEQTVVESTAISDNVCTEERKSSTNYQRG